MKPEYVKTRVLITVMTYPHPSKEYEELVCTAGITDDRRWVRLYPVDYRYRSRAQQFHKYQWIEVGLAPREQNKDNRPESFQPDLESIRIVSPPLGTDNGWTERRKVIDQMPHKTVLQLKADWDRDKTSLGIVRPKRVLDMKIKKADTEWKPEWKAIYDQFRLFGEPPKPLSKIPYVFQYVFECEDSPKPHRAMCEDWELGVLYLNEVQRLGSEEAAAQSVKKKFLGELCDKSKDTRFFMGTRFPYNTWLVLGVFWPPRVSQQGLF